MKSIMSILDLNMGINAGPYFNHLTDNYDYGVKKEMSPAPALSGSTGQAMFCDLLKLNWNFSECVKQL